MGEEAVETATRKLATLLVPRGFVKRGTRAFRRQTADGICQIVEIFVAPEWAASQARDFSVDVAVFIPLVHRMLGSGEVLAPMPADCQVRWSLGELSAPYIKRWFSWSGGGQRAQRDVARMIKSETLPLLDRLSSHESILANWRLLDWEEWLTPVQYNKRMALLRARDWRSAARFLDECVARTGNVGEWAGVLTWDPPGAVVAAILLAAGGRGPEAVRVLRQRYQETQHQGHLRFLKYLAESLGLQL